MDGHAAAQGWSGQLGTQQALLCRPVAGGLGAEQRLLRAQLAAHVELADEVGGTDAVLSSASHLSQPA